VKASEEPFVAWPGWRHLSYAAILTAVVDVLFAAVYFGADYVTGLRAHHLHLFLRQELAIPLWPSMILVYDSLYLLFILAPFVLRTREHLNRLALTAAATITASGILFLIFPAELGFRPPIVTGPFKTIFEVSDKLNLDYNLVPSLHVGLAMICLQAFWPKRSLVARTWLAVWGVALVLSTLLTHQHHVLDAVSGAGLALVIFNASLSDRRELYAE
jgi:membrane-associated phospholipid phosphatase